ncbi:MAG: autoinducer binding domain-containing protein [Stenotrophomonas sp.]
MEAWREDQLNALLAPDGQDDLFGRIAGMVRALGFEHCAYGVRAPLPLAQPEIVMLNDYPEDLAEALPGQQLPAGRPHRAPGRDVARRLRLVQWR